MTEKWLFFVKKKNERILNFLSGLPTAAAMLYVWIVSNASHVKEREAWRTELNELTKTFNLIDTQIQKLDFVIENYVVKQEAEICPEIKPP